MRLSHSARTWFCYPFRAAHGPYVSVPDNGLICYPLRLGEADVEVCRCRFHCFMAV